MFFGNEKATFMRKLQRHCKAVAEEIASLDRLLVQQEHESVGEEKILNEMRMSELVMARKQLDVILCFASNAAKHGVSSGAFAKSVSTEMHRMTMPPAIDPAKILPSCMLLSHFKCSLESCSHTEFWQKCRLSELEKFSLTSTDTVEGVAADIIGDKIAQYTKGARAVADIKALEAWLQPSLWRGVLPPALEEQIAAVQLVVSLARGTCESSLSLDSSRHSISLVSDSKYTIASTLLLYPEGRNLLEGARKELSAREIAVSLQKRVRELLQDNSLSALAKLQKIFAVLGADHCQRLQTSWENEAHDVRELWAKIVSDDVLNPWAGWSQDNGHEQLQEVAKVKRACKALSTMVALVGDEHSDSALLAQGVKCCELVESIGGTLDVNNVDHLQSVEGVSKLVSELDARWPTEFKTFLTHLSSEAVKMQIFECHHGALERALFGVTELLPDAWRRWGVEGSVSEKKPP